MEKMSLALNGEQRKAYFEYYAREILVSLFPVEFYNLHKADKPDLQDDCKSIGIEVTLALQDNELHAVALHDNIIDAKSETEKARIKERIKSIGVDFLEYDSKIVGIGYPVSYVTSEPLISAAKNKIDKLNNKGDDTLYEYFEFQHYRLFIYTSNIREKRNYLDELVNTMADSQRNCLRKYEAIYVYSEWFGLWVCDLATKQILEYPITAEQREHFKLRALKLTGDVE